MRQYLIDARNKKGLTQVEAASKLLCLKIIYQI